MPNRRDLQLDQYGISRNRYRELYNFCLQYDEFMKEKQDCYSLDNISLDGMPRGSNAANPTANKAERACRLGENIEIIKQTAIEACGDLYPWMIKAVSKGLTWEDLQPPCGRNQFNQDRRKFFFLLNLVK